MHNFEIISQLGQSGISSVFKVRRILDGSIYVLKQIKLSNQPEKQIYNSVNQVRLLASIRHPNIICYKEAFYDITSKSLCIVMQYADGGDLLEKIMEYKNKFISFEEDYIWKIFYYILKALKVLHDLKILHRDIKSANIFLTRTGMVKLGDMSVSKVLKKDAMCETQTGTPFYASPEVWQDDPYDAKSDLWSLGCVLYQIIAFRPPFRARDMEGLYRKIARGYYPKLPKKYSQDLNTVLQHLIKVRPQQRITCSQLLELPIVKKKTIKFRQMDDIQEKSLLLKTIKLTKNIAYITQKLPKPNYSPMKSTKAELGNKSSIIQYRQKKQMEKMELSLPRMGLKRSSMMNSEIINTKQQVPQSFKRIDRRSSLMKSAMISSKDLKQSQVYKNISLRRY